MVTSALTLPGYAIVRGITARSRSIVGNFFGANITISPTCANRPEQRPMTSRASTHGNTAKRNCFHALRHYRIDGWFGGSALLRYRGNGGGQFGVESRPERALPPVDIIRAIPGLHRGYRHDLS
jgi:hypothetical protein